jgi:hypothetical protein
MRAVENAPVAKKPYAHTRAVPFGKIGAQSDKQRLYILPADIAADRTGKKKLKGFGVFGFHGQDNITF